MGSMISGIAASGLAMAGELPPIPADIPFPASSLSSCAELSQLTNTDADAAPVIAQCVAATSVGGDVAIPAGHYKIKTRLTLSRPVTLQTKGLRPDDPPCKYPDLRCATLHIQLSAGTGKDHMPIEIASGGVTLDHLVLVGAKDDIALANRICLELHARPGAGGVRVSGDNFTLTSSVLAHFACYTALEFRGGKDGRIEHNLFLSNGDHTRAMMWADGLTIHGGQRLRIANNHFVDNSDVQLVFGGCIDCMVTGNRLRHSGLASGGAFAGLMIHAWPDGATTGRYDGSRFAGNDIDCGPKQRCGFGLMIGATPWYDAPTSGGTITGNRIRNAILPLNVDGLTGPMTIMGNRIEGHPAGRVRASCGTVIVSHLVNVASTSRPFLHGDALADASGQSFKKCLLNPAD